MTITNLNAVLLRELSSIATDEDLLQKAIKSIKALKKEAKKNAKEELKPYTMEELDGRIDLAMHQEGGTPSEQVFKDIRKQMAVL